MAAPSQATSAKAKTQHNEKNTKKTDENKNKSKAGGGRKRSTAAAKSERCESFCRQTYLPNREAIDVRWARERGLTYTPTSKLRDRSLADVITSAHMSSCQTIYCRPVCGFASSVNRQRTERLKNQGARSVCRDLTQEYPKYYSKRIF